MTENSIFNSFEKIYKEKQALEFKVNGV